MAYFDFFPDLILPSFSDNRKSSKDTIRVKNLFKRAKLRDDFFENAVVFNTYMIEGDDRPDNVAFKFYGSEFLDWVVLISNNIINVREEWPMPQRDFNVYLNNKYSQDQLLSIHHYETKQVLDEDGNSLLSQGNVVPANYEFKWSYDGRNNALSGSDIMTSISNLEFEIAKNDQKRSINLIRPNYLNVVLEDMREIMTYEDSSQFIDRFTKKGDNLRMLSPR
tara:strand:+ start:635 stop:1300 length:666 start_codon:yes stop_codon:yes gene_type:complete